MLTSLDSAYAFVTTAPRERSRAEPSAELFRAYIDLLFAWGHSQQPNGERRARELLANGAAALPTNDGIHAVVLRLFEQRIREKSASPWSALDVREPMEPFVQYKVHRLFEVSAILSRIERWSPIHAVMDATAAPADDWFGRVLRADGEGQLDVRELERALEMLEADRQYSGASLIGPSARAGRSDRLRAVLRRRYEAAPDLTTAAALTAMGENLELPRFKSLGSHAGRRLAAGRLIVGALALSGRADEAADWLERLWPHATDTMSTNTHFCLAAVALCETAVLGALRHELALGNRTVLDLGAVKQALSVKSHFFTSEDDGSLH